MRFLLFLLLFGTTPTQNDIADLANPGFEIREAASARLEKMQAAAIPRLEYEMWHNKDLEARIRCRTLVEHYYAFEATGEGVNAVGKCEIPITYLPASKEVKKYYIRRAHELLHGDVCGNSAYVYYVLPNKAGALFIQDQLYWGVSKEYLQDTLNEGATNLIKYGPNMDLVAEVLKEQIKP